MKKNLLASILMLSLGAISCSSSSTQFDKDGEKVLETLKKGQVGYREKVHEFAEVKFVRDVTAEDSLNVQMSIGLVKRIIEDHIRMVENIQYQISKSSDPTYSDNSNTTVEERIDEANLFADAWSGKFDSKFTYNTFYQTIYRLKSLAKDKVIGKIYAVKFKRKEDKDWSIDYWLMTPELAISSFGRIDEEEIKPIPKAAITLEKIHFDYVIDSRNFITPSVE